MVLTIIAFKNKKIQASTTPVYVDVSAEKSAVQLARSLKLGKEEDVAKYKGLSMYVIGEYDDEKMEITSTESKLLLDCDEVISKREGAADGE